MPVTLDAAGNVVADSAGTAAANASGSVATTPTLVTLSTDSKWWPLWVAAGVAVGYVLFSPQARKFFS